MCSVKETGLFSIEFHFKSFFFCAKEMRKKQQPEILKLENIN